jgi:hypothetical protein
MLLCKIMLNSVRVSSSFLHISLFSVPRLPPILPSSFSLAPPHTCFTASPAPHEITANNTLANAYTYLKQPEDVNSLLTIKLATQYASSRDVESMRAIARAHQGRNLAEFEKALRDYQLGMSFLFL